MGSQQVRLCVLLAIIPATGACGRDPDKVGAEPTLKIDPSVTLKDDLSGSPSRVVFSPDGRLLAVGQVDGTVTLFDARTWARGAVFKMEPHMVTVLAFSRDGRWLAASSGFTAHVWEVQDREEVASLDHDRVYVTSAAFSADGKELITTTGSNAGWLWSWDLGSKAGAVAFKVKESALLPPGTFPNISRASTHDGKTFALALGPGLLIYDLPGRREVADLYRNEGVTHLCYSPDGKRLAVDLHRKVMLHDTTDWSPKAECRLPEGETVWDVSFTSDGASVVTATARHIRAPGGVCLFEAATGKLLATVTCHTAAVAAARVSPDGKQLATASFDGSVRIWGLADLLKAGAQK